MTTLSSLVSRRPMVAAAALLGALLVCCSADKGDPAEDEAKGAPSTDIHSTGPFSDPSKGGGTAGDALRCDKAGETRSCCNGAQTCGGGEFPAWGPCLDSKGAAATCTDAAAPAPATPMSDAGPPKADASTCGAGMVCKPGAIRYCDTSISEWSKSTCDGTGKWGPCLAATAPAGNGCDPDSYSPEKCCPPLKLCCQDNKNGPFVDFGSGACAATTCSQ